MPWDENGECLECGYDYDECECDHQFDFPLVYFEFKEKRKKKCVLCKKNDRQIGEDYEWRICHSCLSKTHFDTKYLISYKVIA